MPCVSFVQSVPCVDCVFECDYCALWTRVVGADKRHSRSRWPPSRLFLDLSFDTHRVECQLPHVSSKILTVCQVRLMNHADLIAPYMVQARRLLTCAMLHATFHFMTFICAPQSPTRRDHHPMAARTGRPRAPRRIGRRPRSPKASAARGPLKTVRSCARAACTCRAAPCRTAWPT